MPKAYFHPRLTQLTAWWLSKKRRPLPNNGCQATDIHTEAAERPALHGLVLMTALR